MNIGNTTLILYGIAHEKADLRFHVSVVTKQIYIFEPKYVLSRIAQGGLKESSVYTGSILTAKGFLIPPGEIKGCKAVPIPKDILDKAAFQKSEPTSIKGQKAVIVVREMIRRGLISLILDTCDVNDKEMQIEGSDFLTMMANSFQVKCDWNSGPKELGGTGNLFIQYAECNPLRSH